MKVLALLLLAVAVASAAKSGPYLPSGWKPDGPAFFLPGEAQKPAGGAAPAAAAAPAPDAPLKESLKTGTEPGTEPGTESDEPDTESQAEGSDAFREYGPPKLTASKVTVQDLPDEATETAFSNLRTNLDADKSAPGDADDLASRSGDLQDETTEGKPEGATDATQTTDSSTDSSSDGKTDTPEGTAATDVTPVDGEGKSANLEEPEKDGESSDDSNVESKFGDVADDLIKLDNEIKDGSTEAAPGAKPEDAPADAKNADAPESVYGPPGFKEYGPPKEDANAEAMPAEEPAENNEARRRRFSPKFNRAKKAAKPTRRH